MGLIGCVDNLTETLISGWAADDADYERQVSVDIVVNRARVATVRCAVFREDLRNAGVGDGCKGFEMDPGRYLKPGRNHLEVRHAGSNVLLVRGSGNWIRPRGGGISAGDAQFIAALEAYFEFSPEHHIYGIGAWAGELERILRKAELPFRKFTALDVSRGPSVVRLPDKADVVVCWAYATPSAECVRVLKALVRDSVNRPGLLAVGFADRPDAAGRIEAAFCDWNGPAQCESIAMGPGGARRMFAFAQTGGVEQPAARRSPVLAHIHVPKCAGTSLRVLLTRHFGAGHLALYADDTYFVYGEETLRSYLLQDREIRGFSSHHVRAFPRWLAGRQMLYVTFLRDPIEQFVSYMTHFKKYYPAITSESLLEAVPPDAPRLALREFAKWLLTNERDIPFRENHNVNFFSRHNAPAATDRLAAAKGALEEFFFVGITERMEESMAKLGALARGAGLDFPTDCLPVENTSAEYRDDLSWIHPDDEVGSLLLRSVEKDRQLYDWAAARLNR